MLGVVQTADGLPIHHELFEGNAAETKTLVPTIENILKLYPIQRVVLVADRGLLSLDNLESIRQIKVGDHDLGFILAVPARRYGEFDQILGTFHKNQCEQAATEVFGETHWCDFRLVSPDMAGAQRAKRDQTMQSLEEDAAKWTVKLD